MQRRAYVCVCMYVCVCVCVCVYMTSIQVSTYGKAIKKSPRYNSNRHFEVSDQKGVVGAARCSRKSKGWADDNNGLIELKTHKND